MYFLKNDLFFEIFDIEKWFDWIETNTKRSRISILGCMQSFTVWDFNVFRGIKKVIQCSRTLKEQCFVLKKLALGKFAFYRSRRLRRPSLILARWTGLGCLMREVGIFGVWNSSFCVAPLPSTRHVSRPAGVGPSTWIRQAVCWRLDFAMPAMRPAALSARELWLA